MSFRYVSNNGDTLEFGGVSPYYADSDVFRAYDTKYSLVHNAVARFTHDPATYDLPITINAGSEAEGSALLERLQQAFDHDVRAKTPGRFEIGECYANAYVPQFTFDCDESLGLYEIEVKAKVLLPNPVWVMESVRSFNPSDIATSIHGLNYPHDFPHNFSGAAFVRQITNPLSWPCSVRIVIYGEAHNPYIYIGGNRYEVDVDVPRGGTLTIDGLDKSQILLRDRYGNSQNVFDKRISGASGSGTYVFEPIPSGISGVTWNGSFPFDVVLCGERSWVPCTT